MYTQCKLYAELGEIINGSKTIERGENLCTMFKSVGR